jgi:hypothetical protein
VIDIGQGMHQFLSLTHIGTDFERFSVGMDLSTLPRPAQFVSRSRELAEMHQLFYGCNTRSIVVFYGLGGIGKTQLGLAYALRYEEIYIAIFWLNANDEDSLRLSFRAVTKQVLKYHSSTSLLTPVDLNNLDQVMNAVMAWLDLQKNTRWLIIYDNYNNPQIFSNIDNSAVDICRFLPRSNQGSIIIMTRSAQVSEGRRIPVRKLPHIQEGLEILSNMSGRKGIDDDVNAIKLVQELDGLPLVLSTTGAYFEHIITNFLDYFRLYRISWSKLQTTSPQLSSYEEHSLYTI